MLKKLTYKLNYEISIKFAIGLQPNIWLGKALPAITVAYLLHGLDNLITWFNYQTAVYFI